MHDPTLCVALGRNQWNKNVKNEDAVSPRRWEEHDRVRSRLAAGRASVTLSEAMIATLKSAGVKYIFGVPGGGSSLDLIAAADKAGIKFILFRGETSAALAASVVAELTGTPGIVLTAIGPGAASAANGVAYAHLERAPLLLICDARDLGERLPPHQEFDLQRMFHPLTKACVRLTPENGSRQFAELVNLVQKCPEGPALVELSTGDAMGDAGSSACSTVITQTDDRNDLAAEKALELLAGSERPILLIGLQAARSSSRKPLRHLGERLGCPIMTTYKAKGVIPDMHPQAIGHLTGADSEAEAISRADLILWAGVEPVELIPVPWRPKVPLLALSDRPGLQYPLEPHAELSGPLAQSIDQNSNAGFTSAWLAEEIVDLKEGLALRLRLGGGKGHTMESVADAVIEASPDDTRFTVDAGAHMISVMARIQAREPLQVLKSTGLSTMGFALPAAIGSALVDPSRRVVAFTGDGGLLMCLAELSTAARLGCRLIVVVINDAALSLIDIKQQRRQHRTIGVRYPAVDFAAAALGQGCLAWKVNQDESLEVALAGALAHEGSSLIDIRVDPAPYGEQLSALRG